VAAGVAFDTGLLGATFHLAWCRRNGIDLWRRLLRDATTRRVGGAGQPL